MGATLGAEREKRHLSIDDVARELKISPRQLRALEEGDLSSLPHPAYARGFIRSYASWLGMSQEEIHNALENLSPSRPKARKSPDAEDEKYLPETPPTRKSGGGKGFMFFLLLCAIGGGLYYAWANGMLDDIMERFLPATRIEDKLQSADQYIARKDQAEAIKAEEERKNGQVREEAKPREPEKALPMPGNNNETVLAPIADATSSNVADRAEAGMDAARRNPAPVAETSSAGIIQPETANNRTQSESAAPAMPEQHKLVITATEECWVHSNADKTDTRQFSLRKGDTFMLPFSKSLELKLGNAGGVQLRYDGQDLPPAGTSGQVKTLKFPLPENQ